jgi:ADP-ribosylglycohydrolase
MQAALWCALIGDALGVPYEFNRPEDLPPRAALEMVPPSRFQRSHPGTPVGTWSDDGALMLALLDSLARVTPFDLDDFAGRMLAWQSRGQYTPDGRVFDIGFQTSRALDALAEGIPALEASVPSEQGNGNGSLMRVLPVAFLPVDEAEAVRLARLQSMPTHSHVRSQLACALYVLLVRALLTGASKPEALARAAGQLRGLTPADEAVELDGVLARPFRVQGSGYVLDCLWSAWSVFEANDSVRDCLQGAVALGRDTDTTACVAGGLAGAFYGPEGVPADWRAQMQGQAMVEAACRQVAALAAAGPGVRG